MSLLSILAGANSPPVPAWNMPGATHMWRGNSRQVAGSNVTGVLDTIGTAHMVSSATKPTIATLGTKNRKAWTNILASFMSVNVSSEVMTSGAVALVLQVPSYVPAPFTYLGGGLASAADVAEIVTFHTAAWEYGRRDNAGNADAFFATAPLTLRSILWTWNQTNSRLYLDGVLRNSNVVNQVTNPIGRWTMGIMPDLAAYNAVDVVFGEGRIGNQLLGAGDATNFQTYRTLYYG